MANKTYWHLSDRKKIPSEYEIVTSRLHYYKERGGFEVDVPLADWYRRYQDGSELVACDWERFYDPRRTTYTKYTSLQQAHELFVDGVLDLAESSDYDRRLGSEWLAVLELLFAPLRYPVHGLQMISAYVGQMAPSSRVTIAAMFQSADEIRRIQRIAYRIRQLQLKHESFAVASKTLWQEHAVWQPLRKVIEKLLVTYDWGESFVALNLVLKPLVDELFMVRLGEVARLAGDYLLDEVFSSLAQDCQWHRQWSLALVECLTAEDGKNRAVIGRWIDRWREEALPAVQAFEPVLAQAKRPERASGPEADAKPGDLALHYRSFLEEAGLQPAGAGTNISAKEELA